VPLLDHCNAIVQEEGKRIGLSHPERIVLDYECCYGSYLQGRNKAGSGGKKRYAGLVTVHDGRPCEPWVDIKGFETNRSESPPVTVEVQQRVIEMLLVEKRGAKEVFDYVSMVCAEVAGGKRPLLDCIKRVGLGQPYSSYKVVPDYVRAAMYSERVLDKRFRVGDRVYTVPVKKETGRWPRTDVVGLTEFDDGLPDGFVVDWVSLSDKWVKGKVSVFFDLIGLKEQVKALGGRTLESWF
jgi:DNA polymerase elongation subunit (family B)